MNEDFFLGKFLEHKFKCLEESIEKGEKQTMGALKDLADGIDVLVAGQADQALSLTNIDGDIAKLLAGASGGGTITEAQLQPLADKVKAAAKASTDAAAAMKALADSVPDDAPVDPPPGDNP